MAANPLSRPKTLMALLLCTWLGQVIATLPLPARANPGVTDNYDQITAHIPHHRAAIASVALAEVNTILLSAKKNAERALCQGHWTPSGELLQLVGPVVVEPRPGHKTWLYQSLRRAHPLTCDRVSRAQFFLEMSRHLPAWISIQPAGQATAFRQGVVQPLPPSHLAVR